METWSALTIVKQVANELGLPAPTALPSEDVQAAQLLALLNAAGNELILYYPWEQFLATWSFDTVPGQSDYVIPADWGYFIDQTQWDTTNRWPLLGPKSPQEWAWLKSGIVAAAPRMRFRVMQSKFQIWPVPQAVFNFRMEYCSKNWVMQDNMTPASLVVSGSDTVLLHPWLMVKYLKLKFYELKGFDATGPQGDFTRIYLSLTGKDKGAPKLSLSPRPVGIFLGPWSVPDGSWDVTGGTP